MKGVSPVTMVNPADLAGGLVVGISGIFREIRTRDRFQKPRARINGIQSGAM